ncbi:hypothetical protein [Leptospira wolffii]|uniref:hypothetical protein n=1 Tax=Leptospira wolffii TaxID=409998 RepID=UPI0002DFF95D|nr:hypothetical protein [Leptospira wolffii]EPG64641.1 hypothetical protein LEP1GSC061_0070 [Leptospira wolffii serovar Khorat str. Khorat-H2]
MFKKYLDGFREGTRLYRASIIISLLSFFSAMFGITSSRIESIDRLSGFFNSLSAFSSIIALILLTISVIKKSKQVLLYYLISFLSFLAIVSLDGEGNYFKISNQVRGPVVEDNVNLNGEFFLNGSIEIDGKPVERKFNLWSSNVPLQIGSNQIRVVYRTSSGYAKFEKVVIIDRITPEEMIKRIRLENEAKALSDRKIENEKQAKEESEKLLSEEDWEKTCDAFPEKGLVIERWNWNRDIINTTYFSVLVENRCSIPLKDFKFHITYIAASGTVLEGGWETVYEKIEPKQKKWVKFSNSIWNDQSKSASLEIYSASK